MLRFSCLFSFQILQNLGKVDRTADEIFDEHLTNFNRQQNNATRLQKEFNNYIRCIRGKAKITTFCSALRKIDFVCIFCQFVAMQTASKSLMEAIADVYESQWTGADSLNGQTQQIDALWQDFSHKLGDQVLIPLNTYTAQFPEMKVSDSQIPPKHQRPHTSKTLLCLLTKCSSLSSQNYRKK